MWPCIVLYNICNNHYKVVTWSDLIHTHKRNYHANNLAVLYNLWHCYNCISFQKVIRTVIVLSIKVYSLIEVIMLACFYCCLRFSNLDDNLCWTGLDILHTHTYVIYGLSWGLAHEPSNPCITYRFTYIWYNFRANILNLNSMWCDRANILNLNSMWCDTIKSILVHESHGCVSLIGSWSCPLNPLQLCVHVF